MICLFCRQPVPLNHFASFRFITGSRYYIAHWKCLDDTEAQYELDLKNSKSVTKQRGHSIINFLIVLFIIVFVLPYACAVNAQVVIGKTQLIRAPICKTKEAAIAVAKADASDGPEKALAALMGSKECTILEYRAKFVRSVFKNKTSRGETAVIEVLVEMADNSWQTFYTLSDVPVQGELTV